MPKRKLKLTAVTISEIPELIETIESSNLDITNKDKIVTNLMLVAHLADNLEYSRITIAKLRELFGIKAKVPSKEV
jgi:hypothetical protein